MSASQVVNGLTLDQWQAAFRPGMNEFSASSFVFTNEGGGLIRVAFGNLGPAIDNSGTRHPIFSDAVTLPTEVALSLASQLLKLVAAPIASDASTT